MLADVSVDYYIRLERGNARGVSDNVLNALSDGLRLSTAERDYLFDLVRSPDDITDAKDTQPLEEVSHGIRRVLETIGAAPAYVRNARLDLLAANRLGQALFEPVFKNPARPANLARFTFLDPAARQFFRNWESIASDYVALLRAEAGRSPADHVLSELIGELSADSQAFRSRWPAHNVQASCSGAKEVHHPLVGDLSLTFEALDVADQPGLRLNVYTAEPGSPAQNALDLLASRLASQDPVNARRADTAP